MNDSANQSPCSSHKCPLSPSYIMTNTHRTNFFGTSSACHKPRRKKYSSSLASCECFHTSTGMPSGPADLPFFIRCTASMYSSCVSSSCPSPHGPRSGYASLDRSSSVVENLFCRNYCHSSPSSSAQVILSPFAFRDGCVEAALLVEPASTLTP